MASILVGDKSGKLQMWEREELQKNIASSGVDSFDLPDHEDVQYLVWDKATQKKTYVSGSKAKEILKKDPNAIFETKLPKKSAWKTFGERLPQDLTFGLYGAAKGMAGLKAKGEEAFSGKEEFEQAKKLREKGFGHKLAKGASFGLSIGAHAVGTGGTSLLGAGVAKAGAPALSRFASKLAIGKYADKAGKFTEKGLSKFLKSQKSAKTGGRIAEFTAWSVPAAASVGIDNRDPWAAAKVIGGSMLLGGAFGPALAVAKLGTKPFQWGGAALKKGVEGVSGRYSKKFFNIGSDKELTEVVDVVNKNAPRIIENLSKKSRKAWEKIAGGPLTPEKIKGLKAEEKMRIYSDSFRNALGTKAWGKDKTVAFEGVKERATAVGNELKKMADELNEAKPAEVLFKGESGYGGASATQKTLNEISKIREKSRFSGFDLTPAGKRQNEALSKAEQFVKKKQEFHLFNSKKFKDLTKFKNTKIKQSQSVVDDFQKIGGDIVKRIRAKADKGLQLTDAERLAIKNYDKNLMNLQRQHNKYAKNINEVYKNTVQTADVKVNFRDLKMLENIYKLRLGDKAFKENPKALQALNRLKEFKDDIIPSNVKSSWDKLNKSYNELKVLQKQFNKPAATASALQGLGVFQTAAGLGTIAAAGYLAGPPGLAAAALAGVIGYNVFPVMTQKGWGNLAASDWLTRLQSGLTKSSEFQKMLSNPSALQTYMKKGKDSVMGVFKKSVEPVSVKGIQNYFDVEKAPKEKSEEKGGEVQDLVSLFDNLVNKNYDNSYGSIDAMYSMYQNAGVEGNPALDVEKFKMKEKYKSAALFYMPREIKKAKFDDIKNKSVKIPMWKVKQFKEDFAVAVSPERVVEKVRDSSLTTAQAMGFMRFSPREHKELVINMLNVKDSLSYTQKKALDKLMGADKGGFYAYETTGHAQEIKRQKGSGGSPRKVSGIEANLTPLQRGYEVG